MVTWPSVSDASGVPAYYASIDMLSDSVPLDLNFSHAVSQALTEPGAYYAHVRAVDGLGNAGVSHLGPFLVNRLATPSLSP